MTIRSGDTSMTSLNVSKYVLHSSWNRRIALNLRPRNAFCIKRFISSDFVKISPAVLDCVERGKPVVALESTILTHGLPQGNNNVLYFDRKFISQLIIFELNNKFPDFFFEEFKH